MKKIIIIALFIACFSFLPTTPTSAINMEVNVVIDSVKIPERSVMLFSYLAPEAARPNTEFWTCSSARISVVNNANVIQSSAQLTKGTVWLGCLAKGSSAKVLFNYDAGSAPYRIYTEFQVSEQAVGETIYKADCSSIIRKTQSDIPWYFSFSPLLYVDDSYLGNEYANCTNYYCDSNYCRIEHIAVPPESVFQVASTYYWRSLTLRQID